MQKVKIKLEETKGCDWEIVELHKREQKLNEEKVIESMEQNPEVAYMNKAKKQKIRDWTL